MIEGDSMLSLRPSRVSGGPRAFYFVFTSKSDGIDQCSLLEEEDGGAS